VKGCQAAGRTAEGESPNAIGDFRTVGDLTDAVFARFHDIGDPLLGNAAGGILYGVAAAGLGHSV
jgi:hypothetical protein